MFYELAAPSWDQEEFDAIARVLKGGQLTQAGEVRRFRIRSIVGDRVHVEMIPYDLSEGRIVYREKLAGQSSGPKRRSFRR